MSNLSKNLRREVRRQLKELRGGVGRKAVGEQAGLATKTMTKTMTKTVTPTRTSGKPSALLWGDKSPVVATDAPLASAPLKRDSASIAEYELTKKNCRPLRGVTRSLEGCLNGKPCRVRGAQCSVRRRPIGSVAKQSERNGGGNNSTGEQVPLAAMTKTKTNDGETIVNCPLSIVNCNRPSLPELEQFVRRDYDLRYNVLTEQTEYRRRGELQGEFRPATQRVYRTWLTDLQREGIDFWKIDGLRTAIESMHIEDYHPVKHYFTTLPEWDGRDRIAPLMRRLTDDEVMVGYLSRWLLAFVAQAQGREEALYANSVAPILISEQQGWHKSTFCRLLLPPRLRMFYTDNFDLTAESQCERRLTDCLLINLDEYDRYNARKQSTLKNLMQMPSLRMRKAYARNATTLPRIASFIGTSNTPHLLTDTTGSRRFLCVELAHMIDVDTPIEYEQLYAQCMHLLNNGERHHFTAEEVTDIELRNRAYRCMPPVEEHCMKYFRLPREGETPQLMSAAEIYEELRQRNPRIMRGVCERNFGALLREWGFKRVEHLHRRMYKVFSV